MSVHAMNFYFYLCESMHYANSVDTICRAKPNVSPPGCATSRWRDENQFFRKNLQKLVAMVTSLEGPKN